MYDCIGIHKDLKGNIVGYILRDLRGYTISPTIPELKNAMRHKLIVVGNMTLSKNNRLIIKNKSYFERKNLIVCDNTTFEMWLNNILEKIKERYGGEKGIADTGVNVDGTYDFIYSHVRDIPIAGGRKINICINIGNVVMGDRRKHLVLTIEDVISGVTIDETEVKLKSPLCCQDNTKIIENAVDRIIMKNLGHIIKEYINSRYNGGK